MVLPATKVPVGIASCALVAPAPTVVVAAGGDEKSVSVRPALEPNKLVTEPEIGGNVTILSVAICLTEKEKFTGDG